MSTNGVEAGPYLVKQHEQKVLLKEIYTPPLPTDSATLVNKPAFATPLDKAMTPITHWLLIQPHPHPYNRLMQNSPTKKQHHQLIHR